METQNSPLIVIIPTPGMGHLFPLVKLAKQIIQLTTFRVTFIIPPLGPPTQLQKSSMADLPEDRFSSHFLPPVNLNDVPNDALFETRMSINLSRSLPNLRAHLKNLQKTHHHVTAIVVDLFGTDFFDAAFELGIKPYLFFASTGMCLSFFLNLPQLDYQVSGEFRDLDDPIELPGCIPIHGKDLLNPVQDRTNEGYKWVLYHAKRYKLAEGIMVNTFDGLEEGVLRFLTKDEPGKPLVYPVGPLVRVGSGDEKLYESDCLKWLDDQPRGSVLFVSFGSAGSLSHEQIIELAHGLEMSEQRFLWVLRNPRDPSQNPMDFLPNGFFDRTKEKGLVSGTWAPQVEILQHRGIGGFLTHCGWNSILESVAHSVPLIAWPLYAEQKMNAVLVTEGMKIAVKPNPNEKGLIGRGEIVNVVKSLMEGEEGKNIHNRMKDLKDASIRAMGEDGSSRMTILEVVQKWRSH